jgi:hypothetical protein
MPWPTVKFILNFIMLNIERKKRKKEKKKGIKVVNRIIGKT